MMPLPPPAENNPKDSGRDKREVTLEEWSKNFFKQVTLLLLVCLICGAVAGSIAAALLFNPGVLADFTGRGKYFHVLLGGIAGLFLGWVVGAALQGLINRFRKSKDSLPTTADDE